MNIDREKLNRARGAIVGLACGDALGTTLEFRPPGSFEPIKDMQGGGPFGLAKGQWTDDTSMALCLAASLVEKGNCDPVDQLQRYVRWRDEGYMSCTGDCFDIGNTVSAALGHFRTTGDAASGSTDVNHSGNGALMRMAPVIVFNSADIDAARKDARMATVTTHGSAFCVEMSDLFTVLLWLAINGATKDEVLDSGAIGEWIDPAQLQPEAAAIMNGSYKQKNPPDIRGTGFVVESLEAALWALYHHDDFETGALAAANLGNDADTTAAIYGQLAGALYGYDAIPVKWQDQIAWHQKIKDFADTLFLGVSPELMA